MNRGKLEKATNSRKEVELKLPEQVLEPLGMHVHEVEVQAREVPNGRVSDSKSRTQARRLGEIAEAW